jgi:hypothetical protein
MSDTIWHYVENQFDNCTKQSKKRMNRISSDHASKLLAENADLEIHTLYTRFAPLRTSFSDAYADAIAANAIYKGRTQKFENLKKELTGTKIEDWDIQIQVVFRKDSPEYIELLPNGRKPFQSGTNDQRIEEVRALGLRLAAYPALAAVKTSVDAFKTSIENARNDQQQKEDLVKQKSNLLEIARVATAKMMYGNLGVLMDKFRDDPKQIERFFDLEAIRNTGPETNETLEGPVAGGDSVNIISDVTDPETEWLLANPGITILAYFLSPTADGVYDGTGIKVNPGETITKKASELGVPENTFLNVTNQDPDNQGYYSVTVM